MRHLFILVAHLLTSIATLLGPGGARAVVADSLLMKQQLLISNRHRKRAPRLTRLDRFLLGFWSLFLIHRRIHQAAVIIRPSTLLKFHQLLKQRKFRLLYTSSGKTNPGPKGPSTEIIDAVVELKRRNPQFGCPRIAQQISQAFGISIDKCESVRLRSHWVLVVMDQFTRRIIGFGVHQGDVDGVALCRLFNHAISSKGIPKPAPSSSSTRRTVTGDCRRR